MKQSSRFEERLCRSGSTRSQASHTRAASVQKMQGRFWESLITQCDRSARGIAAVLGALAVLSTSCVTRHVTHVCP
eukprot:5505125-Prymnesium_polylepis.2